ncbi:pirin family protein (plasmid) [Rhizobium sp. CB3171]|uniref:pirin family protein n=1 Tax=Rhizobium sp. CB3171 TaxID=3039157 RepID=UPI0024B0DD9E|nr:pirin family protein [Rhizobium sp. CB3171]WFU07237.1 pirin family protein [Rhizobium sp. CB3171]
MIEHRPFTKLPAAKRGWLNARFHFVHDGMGLGPGNALGPLIAWNDDEVAPRSGFPEHPHDNVEIVTYVREGAITHEDTLGNKGRAVANEVQVMSAGTGLRHAEYNDGDEPVRLFQIWLETRSKEASPNWDMTRLPDGDSTGGFRALASGAAEDADAVHINADARVLGARMAAGEKITQPLAKGRAYLVSTRASVDVNDVTIEPRSGCRVEGEAVLEISAIGDTEIVLVELI